LFTKFKKSSITLFLDPSSIQEISIETNKKIDIVLSPSLYWVKKLSLPVKSVREVKKLLESIFEDTLLDGDYSYSAYKKGNDFFVFAYEDKKILEQLTKAGISPSNVSSIHFAQSEIEDIEIPLKINNTQSIYIKDDILIVVPTAWLSESEELNLDNIKLSKHTIKLQQYGHIVKNSSLYKIGTILSILIIIIIVEIFITSSKISTIEDKKEKLFTKYRLQPTMIQNKSTLKKYTKIYKRQTKLRKYISYFLTLKLKNDQKIDTISYKEKKLNVKISATTQNNMNSILSQLDAKNLTYTKSLKNNTLYIEVNL